MFLFISGQEIFIIIIIAVMLFGADKIPEIARGLGKGMRQIKDATNDVKREINNSAKENGMDTEFIKDIKNEVNQVKKSVTKNFEDLTGPIKRKR
jgi:sec-independent protein translocase protein TatA